MARHRAGPDSPVPPHHHTHGAVDGDVTDWESTPAPPSLWRTRIVVPALLMVAVVVLTWWVTSWLTGPASSPDQPDAVPFADSASVSSGSSTAVESMPNSTVDRDVDSDDSSDVVVVHVAGEVRRGGLVRLPEGSRVADAVEAAGGATGEAHLDLVNLAAPVADGTQILIPGPDTPAAILESASAQASPGSSGAAAGGGTVNVNSANSAALDTLPGIGPALAQRIIDHREQVGPFGSLEDLGAVSGIGPKMLERLEGQVSW